MNNRLCLILRREEPHHNRSIPAAMHGRAKAKASYRFFAHESVTPEAIHAPHYAMTKNRIAEHPDYLLVQDTTELELTRPIQQVDSAGPTNSEPQYGAFVHPPMAILPDGIPLGFVWKKTWTRDATITNVLPQSKNIKQKGARSKRK